MKLFRIFILSLFGLFILTALVLESPLGGRLAEVGLAYFLKRSGVRAEVGSISGRIPQHMHLHDVHLPNIDGKELFVDSMQIDLALLPLLSGELQIERLTAEGVRISEAVEQGASKTPASMGRMSLGISVQSLHLTRVQWMGGPELDIRGKGSLRRRGRSASMDLTVRRYDSPDASLHLMGTRSRFGKWDLSMTLDAPSLSALKPWIDEEVAEGSVQAEISVRGTPDQFTGTIDSHFRGAQTGVLPEQLFKRDWSLKARIQKQSGEPMRFQRLLASTQGLRLQGFAEFDHAMKFNRAHLQLRGDLHAFSFPIDAGGTVFASGEITRSARGFDTTAHWSSPLIKIDSASIHDASGKIHGVIGERSFLGDLEATGEFLRESWVLTTALTYRTGAPVLFEQIKLESPLLHAEGSLALRPDQIWVGRLSVGEINLQLLERWNPAIAISGIGSGECLFQVSDSMSQEIRARLEGQVVRYQDISSEQLSASGIWIAGALDHLSLTLTDAKWTYLHFDSATLETFGDAPGHPTHVTLTGSGKTPLDLRLDGFWRKGWLELTSAEGSVLHHDISLLQPLVLEWSPSTFSLDPLYLSFGDGLLRGSLRRNGDQTDANLYAEHMPIDLLSINPLETKVQGFFNADGVFKQRGHSTDAEAQITLMDGRIESEGQDPLTATGTAQAVIHQNRLQIKTTLEVQDRPLFALDLDMPLDVSTWPPKFSMPAQGPIAGSVFARGQIEDLLDFFNLGMHRLQADCHCDIQLSGTVAEPTVQGSCRFLNGYYQNYLTGTEITHITGTFKGEKDRFVLTSFAGQDYAKQGEITATGYVKFSFKDRFPFHFDVDFSRLNVAQIDLIDAEAQGHVAIDGSLRSAIAKGHVEIIESDIAIPDKIAPSYPDLQVVYKHRVQPPSPPPSPTREPYPLTLDLDIQAPDGIFIGGRGLNSEWKGNFLVSGTYTEPEIVGKLELINGEFVFAGHRFKLTDGSLSLKGNQYNMPIIDISGQISEQGILITARLKGPLNHPQITFHSIPPLPLSGILSYLLFGKDLSEVNGLQALQLASTIASVSGQGPDIMEITRKSLGVDRLQIVMVPSGEGKETVALQVGKILTPGIVLTVQQGANDKNPSLGIEVDLTHGFTFEAESEQQPEQGKFSLKWNLNY